MNRKPVESSHLKSVGFDKETHTLEIEFKQGKVYSYKPITQEGYEAFLKAPSIGEYFNKFIRTNSDLTVERVK